MNQDALKILYDILSGKRSAKDFHIDFCPNDDFEKTNQYDMDCDACRILQFAGWGGTP